MKKIYVDNLRIIYDDEYIEERTIIENNYEEILKLINDSWGLKEPDGLNIYILRSSLKYLILSSSWLNKIIICTIGLPYWFLKEKKKWDGWYGISDIKWEVPNILLKPMELYNKINKKFLKEMSHLEAFKRILCQELTQVALYNLKPPLWFIKGIANYTVDKYKNIQTVKNDTIKILKEKNHNRMEKIELKKDNDTAFVYNEIKGYWTIKYLEENYPGFLKETFQKDNLDIEKEIAKRLDLSTDKEVFWDELDELLYNHYKDKISD